MVRNIAKGAGGLGFDYRAAEIGPRYHGSLLLRRFCVNGDLMLIYCNYTGGNSVFYFRTTNTMKNTIRLKEIITRYEKREEATKKIYVMAR